MIKDTHQWEIEREKAKHLMGTNQQPPSHGVISTAVLHLCQIFTTSITELERASWTEDDMERSQNDQDIKCKWKADFLMNPKIIFPLAFKGSLSFIFLRNLIITVNQL